MVDWSVDKVGADMFIIQKCLSSVIMALDRDEFQVNGNIGITFNSDRFDSPSW